MKLTPVALMLALSAAPAFAEGDAAAGETAFGRQCQTCHVVQNAAGETLAGRAAKTGPNLFGMDGRVIGSLEGFNYGDSIAALGATGLVWTEEDFVAYVQDPTAFLRDKLGDQSARSKMSWKVRSAEDAENLWAFLASFQ